MCRAWLLFLLMVAMLLSPLAFANAKPGAFTLTWGGGYLFFTPKRNLKNTAIPSYAAFTYNFDEKWAMAVAAHLVNAHSHDHANQHLHGFLYLWDQLYRVPTAHRVDPYLLAGFHVFSLKPSPQHSVNQGGANLGLGVEFFKNSGIALSAEAREVYTFSGGKNDILLNAGINFIWE